jgi:hypothetical protein
VNYYGSHFLIFSQGHYGILGTGLSLMSYNLAHPITRLNLRLLLED